jgi:O-antigen/teichoic acid export membrane protein
LNLEPARRSISVKMFESVIRIAAGLVVSSISVRRLGVTRFATLSYLLSLVSLVGPLTGLGMEIVASRAFARDESSQHSFLRAVLKIRMVGTTLAACVLLLFAALNQPNQILLIAFSSLLLLVSVPEVPLLLVQTRDGSEGVTRLRIPALIVGTLARLTCALLLPTNLFVLLSAMMLEPLLLSMLVFRKIKRYPKSAINLTSKPQFTELLREGFPYLCTGIAIMVYLRIDVVLLERWSIPTELAKYSIAVKVSELLYFVPTAISAAMIPKLIHAYELDPAKCLVRLRRLTGFSTAFAGLIVIAISVSAPVILNLGFGKNYVNATNVLRIHATSLVFVFLSSFKDIWFIITKSGAINLFASISGAVINIYLNSIWLTKHGAIGAATATTVSYFASAVLVPLLTEPGRRFFLGDRRFTEKTLFNLTEKKR